MSKAIVVSTKDGLVFITADLFRDSCPTGQRSVSGGWQYPAQESPKQSSLGLYTLVDDEYTRYVVDEDKTTYRRNWRNWFRKEYIYVNKEVKIPYTRQQLVALFPAGYWYGAWYQENVS